MHDYSYHENWKIILNSQNVFSYDKSCSKNYFRPIKVPLLSCLLVFYLEY